MGNRVHGSVEQARLQRQLTNFYQLFDREQIVLVETPDLQHRSTDFGNLPYKSGR